jgi:integrase/recombinase XerD
MHVAEAVDEYLYALRSRAAETRRSSQVALREFAAWCREQQIQLETLSQSHIRRYSEYLHKRGARRGGTLATESIHTYLMRVKTFLSWASREDTLEDIISEKLAKRIDMPGHEHKVIEVFTGEQYQALYDACVHEHYEQTIYRDRAILSVLIDTGIRASELCGLTLEHVFFFDDDSFIRVVGKGRKEREVGLGATSRKLLRVYIHRWRKAAKSERRVFVNRMGRPMTPRGLNEMLDRLEEWSGITNVRVSCHTFRHTFACQYLLQGGDVYKLSRLLGHNSVRVTERYLGAVKAKQARQGGHSVLDHLKDHL